MISTKEALEIVLSNTQSWGSVPVGLGDCIDRILAVDILADRPFPPFDRVTMDGIAINYEAFQKGQRVFTSAGIAAAGAAQLTLDNTNHCIEIMTGAILPDNTDTIIRYEDLKQEGDTFEILVDIKQGRNIHKQGRDHQDGAILLNKGTTIKAIDVNVLATVGMSVVQVVQLPTVAIVSSGDELVDVETIPKKYQIRKSNSYMLQAALRQLGIDGNIYHCNDDKATLLSAMTKIINDHDVVILSGGVSKGKYDYIPGTLDDLGVIKHFHRVAQKPGKPFWFGTRDEKTVFAFPGNPVSTLLCFLKYFRPWLSKSLTGQEPKNQKVQLAEDFTFKPNLSYFAQAKLSQNNHAQQVARIEQGNGSGDLVNPTRMDGFIELPNDQELFRKGEFYPFISFD